MYHICLLACFSFPRFDSVCVSISAGGFSRRITVSCTSTDSVRSPPPSARRRRPVRSAGCPADCSDRAARVAGTEASSCS